MTAVTRPTRKLVDARVGARVATKRRRLEFSQAFVAEKLGLSEAEFVACESGARRLEPTEIMALAKLLGVTPGWFFRGLATSRLEFPIGE